MVRLRSEVQELYSVSETVTKVWANRDASPRFDGRHNAGHAVMFLDHARFLFHLRKDDRKQIVVIRIVFAGQANQQFGRNLDERNAAPSGKRMLRSDRHANALVKQLFISQVAERTTPGRSSSKCSRLGARPRRNRLRRYFRFGYGKAANDKKVPDPVGSGFIFRHFGVNCARS